MQTFLLRAKSFDLQKFLLVINSCYMAYVIVVTWTQVFCLICAPSSQGCTYQAEHLCTYVITIMYHFNCTWTNSCMHRSEAPKRYIILFSMFATLYTWLPYGSKYSRDSIFVNFVSTLQITKILHSKISVFMSFCITYKQTLLKNLPSNESKVLIHGDSALYSRLKS